MQVRTMKRKAPETVTLEVFKKPRTQQVSRTVVKRPSGQQMTFVPRSLGNPLAVTERKYFDSIKTSANLTSAAGGSWNSAEVDPATLNCLFAPVTGDDFNNRTGRKVQVIALKIRGLINTAALADQTAGATTPSVRLLLVQDQQTNAAQLNSEDVLGNAVTSPIFAFQNPAFFGRFRVLKDKYFTVAQPIASFDGTNIEVAGNQKTFKINIKFQKPVVVHFNSTNGGTVADIIDNSFHMIAAQGQNAGIQCAITYQCRTTFLDQ